MFTLAARDENTKLVWSLFASIVEHSITYVINYGRNVTVTNVHQKQI